MRRGDYRNYYKGHMDKIKREGVGWREGISHGVVWRDGEKGNRKGKEGRE